MNAIPYALVFIAPALVAVGLVLGGWWTLSALVFTFVMTPLLDQLLGKNRNNLDDESEQARLSNPLFDLWLYLWVPAQLGVLLMSAWLISSGVYSGWELAGLTLSVGVTTGGGGINIAHELMHRRGRLPRALAEVLMTSVSYPHFCVEHILGHHRNVATPHDAATARLGESLYRFLPRSLWGGLRSAWRLESERVVRLGISGLADRRIRYPLSLGLIYAALLLASPLSALFFAAQSAIAFVLLEVINYVEHYGLSREKHGERYERVQPRHSWNSPHRLTGWYLFNLPRHADHHFLASRPYPLLRHHEDSPQLPAGYSTMVLLATCPPLWRRVMDQRAAAWA